MLNILMMSIASVVNRVNRMTGVRLMTLMGDGARVFHWRGHACACTVPDAEHQRQKSEEDGPERP
ncbi:MAG: hypothetical protein AB7P23_06530 [Amphiplicatus sp.]